MSSRYNLIQQVIKVLLSRQEPAVYMIHARELASVGNQEIHVEFNAAHDVYHVTLKRMLPYDEK